MNQLSRTIHGLRVERIELKMTAMIDVTFLILIFFMCTMKFRVAENRLEAHLPHGVGIGTCCALVESVDIRIVVVDPGTRVTRLRRVDPWRPWSAETDTHLHFQYGNDRVVHYRMGGRKYSSIDDLRAVLERILSADPEVQVRIEAPDEQTIHQDVVDVLDLALDVRAKEIAFARYRE